MQEINFLSFITKSEELILETSLYKEGQSLLKQKKGHTLKSNLKSNKKGQNFFILLNKMGLTELFKQNKLAQKRAQFQRIRWCFNTHIQTISSSRPPACDLLCVTKPYTVVFLTFVL